MLRYLRIQDECVSPQALLVVHKQQAYFPHFIHAAIDQDRPLGDIHTFQEHEHDLYHIVLYPKQSGSYRKSGRLMQAKPGTLVVVSPQERHSFVEMNRPSVYSELTFSFNNQSGSPLTVPFEELLNLYTGVEGRLIPDLVLSKGASQEMTMMMIQIMDYLQSPAVLSDFYAYRALAHVFDLIVNHGYTEKVPTERPMDDKGILQVKRHIDEHYAESISAEQLAELAHCSKGHLFKVFKKAFQISPLAYQQTLRFEAAQRLLRFTSLSCYVIAERVGYGNVQYFHRQFKNKAGMTPQQYRRAIRQAE